MEPGPAADNEADMPAAPMRLVVSCPDRPGIVAAVARFLSEAGANVVQSDQYSTDPVDGTFFLRMVFSLPLEKRRGFGERFGMMVAEPRQMTWRLWDSEKPKRVAVLVSREEHCLLDLLWRWRRDELDADIVLVASNWEDSRSDVEGFGLPFHHVPVTPETKPEAERRLLELLDGRCDLVVLARYMQIVSGEFLDRLAVPVINIHHSFLPAFAGAGPYAQAKARGVKLIGATAHYVTAELDGGPIIEQDVVRVSHAQTVSQLARAGAEIERSVFTRAVQWHCEDRVIRHGSTTVVF